MRTTNDKLADTLIGNNRGSIVADKVVSSSHEFVCPLSEACGNVPANAQYISMLINGETIEVKSASDVLTWVCRKMWITRMARLLPILRSRKYSWFKTDCCGMVRPLRISCNCYVDLDRFGTTALSRAVQVLEWSGPHKAITITYRLPSEQIKATQKDVTTDGPERELKDVPTDVLVRTVLLEILKQGRDDGETWEDFMSAPRCRRELGLRNSLLHKMKPWEKTEKYAGEYSVFDEEADYMILSDLGRLDREGFLEWVQNLGISLEEVCTLLHVKLPCVPAPVPSHYCESQIAELLETEFANGIRPGSIIDRNKIRKLYRQHFGEDLPGDFAFDTVLPKVGVVHDGKVFPRPSVKDGDWRDLIERLVGNGSSVFQFSRVMELHAAELMKIGIVSAEMLREAMMREALDTYEISGEVFAPKSEVRLADRFDSMFMPQDGAVIDMTDISKRFPYVDVAFIRNLYKGHPNLIRIDQDRYAILARIDFDDSEVSRGRSYCETAIASDGFFSLAQLRLGDSAAMNDQRLTDNALRRVFFQRFLSDDFDAHGQIVCAKGASIDGQIPLHAFLNDRSEVSLDQIESVAKEYNIAPWLALKTAHEEMVRIDRDRFIAKDLISFDVAAIDDSIADVCEGCPRPFGAFANLADFPAVPGFSWNEYLLEAFLRRLSVRFRLVSPSVPARDVSGAVVPRSADLPCAEDAFAAIALRCGVAAETEEVGDFLVATQCVLRRSTKTVGAVVSRMKELEKR